MKKMSIAKLCKRTVASGLLACMLMQSFSVVSAAESNPVTDPTYNSLQQMAELMTSMNYEEYLLRNDDAEKATSEIFVSALDYDVDKTTAQVVVVNDEKGVLPGGITGKSLVIPETGRVYWTVNVPETALYNIDLTYYPFDNLFYEEDGTVVAPITETGLREREAVVNSYKEKYNYFQGKTAAIERIFLLDDEVPFKEARYLTFNRIWKDNYFGEGERVFEQDVSGNEIKPTKYESPEWSTLSFKDSSAFYNEAFLFYLEAGEHTIALESSREPMLINSIRFYAQEELKTYEQVKAEYEKNGYTDVSAEATIKIHAETPVSTSDQVIYAVNDRTSALTYPQDAATVKLNTIGGEKWQIPGQWIRYEFTPTESGLYQIIPRSKQDVYAGMFASRSLKINGEYPFEEAKNLKFSFSDNWQSEPLGTEDEDFKFYFEAGKTYTLEFEVVLGDMANVIRNVEESVIRMNEYYRKVLMITGPEPDAYTDYDFARRIPAVLRGLRDEAEKLYAITAELAEIIGAKGESTVLLDKVAYIINIMGNDQDKIAANLSNLKSNIGSLGTWLLTARNQPLQLDSITIQSANEKAPRAEANFFQSIWFELKSFVMSFWADYNSLGAKEKIKSSDDILEVWITDGREQASIIRQMVSEFTQETGVPVNVKLVAAGTLLPATLAGVGPDVATEADPTSFGVRSAVTNLKERDVETGEYIYEGLEEVMARFSPAAFTHITVYNPDATHEMNREALYGIPVTQSFPMLFYRKDIFVELGLEVPETWDDVYAIVKKLSENNMEMGIPNDNTLIAGTTLTQILMYQLDEPWYKGDTLETLGMATNLDSNTALDCFETMCDLFSLYRQPVTFDFANRFRTGEMPIAIQDISLYNQLTVFAPEIKGLWEMVRLPGTVREDGTINHTATTSSNAIMIMRDADHKDTAWEYIKWWTSAESQERFGKEQVATMGSAAKYFTANIEALQGQPWSAQELKNINQQFQSLQGTPMTPGNYIVTRNTKFAFLSVVNDSANPSEALLSYIQVINKELTRKREEYDFLTYEEYMEREGENAE